MAADGTAAGAPPSTAVPEAAPVASPSTVVPEAATAAAPPSELAGGRLSNGAGHESGVDGSRARRLLSRDADRAFDDGCAPELLRGLGGRVAAALSAERAPQYVNLLYALVLMRRAHELEPRHEDLWARVLGPQRMLGSGTYGPDEYAADMEQLVAWGAVWRVTEARRLRGYKDNRRAQYRYRITDDALAMIEWLEGRLAAALDGRARDSRNLLADVVGALKEARRVLEAWRKGERGLEAARRAYYLLEVAAGAIGGVSEELLGFRAEMILFAQRPYDVGALREILAWLERYVQLYLGRLRELRVNIRDRLAALSAPRFRQAWAECRAELEREREAAPRFVRARAPLRGEAELLDAAERFFRHEGRLAELCRHIDDSARAVVLKMHRHVRELERRSARLEDLRATIAGLAAQPAEDDPRYAAYINDVLASAHGRFDRRAGTVGHRVAPPAPRKHELPASRRAAARPLADKQVAAAEARALRAKALAELGRWVHARLLAGRGRVRLSAAGLDQAGDARRVMDVARARHLADGRHLAALDVRIEPAEGRARVGGAGDGLDAPDAAIVSTRKDPPP